VLTTFGWTSGRYAHARDAKRLALLRCKALSLAYQYPGCPIIQALAHYGLRVTEGVGHYQLWRVVNGKSVNEYQRTVLREALLSPIKPRPIGANSRLLVERMYGVAVEAQLAFERYLDGLTRLQVLDPGVLAPYLPDVWVDYCSKYVIPPPL